MSQRKIDNLLWAERRAEELAAKAATRDATNAALAAVLQFNATIAAGRRPLSAPTIEAATLSKHYWMRVFCPGCQTVRDVDLTMVPRPPDMAVTEVARKLSCREPCQGRAPVPRIMALATRPLTLPRW